MDVQYTMSNIVIIIKNNGGGGDDVVSYLLRHTNPFLGATNESNMSRDNGKTRRRMKLGWERELSVTQENKTRLGGGDPYISVLSEKQ